MTRNLCNASCIRNSSFCVQLKLEEVYLWKFLTAHIIRKEALNFVYHIILQSYTGFNKIWGDLWTSGISRSSQGSPIFRVSPDHEDTTQNGSRIGSSRRTEVNLQYSVPTFIKTPVRARPKNFRGIGLLSPLPNIPDGAVPFPTSLALSTVLRYTILRPRAANHSSFSNQQANKASSDGRCLSDRHFIAIQDSAAALLDIACARASRRKCG
jgi:hypothetical protein